MKESPGKIMKAPGSVQDLRREGKVKYPVSDIILLPVAAIAGSVKQGRKSGMMERIGASSVPISAGEGNSCA